MPTLLHHTFDRLLQRITEETRRHYGNRLSALAVFGSVGRETMRHTSDIDLLVVVHDLPNGRVPRIEEFGPIERAVAPDLQAAAGTSGVDTRISAVIRTPAEIGAGSPLMLDMTQDARLLHDPAGILADALADLRRRLDRLGARRIWRDGWWYWDLKPDFRRGETFEI
jgi:hypothetical protein